MQKGNVKYPRFYLGIGIVFILIFTTTSLLRANPPSKSQKTSQSSMILLARYLSDLHSKIQKKWDVSKIPYMELHRRSAVLQLWINKKGRLVKIKIGRSSGFHAFDRSILKAAFRASPYPPPPHSIRKATLKEGFEIVLRKRVFRKTLLPLRLHYKGTTVVPSWKKKSRSRK